jgi:hypothetical protein
MYDYWLFIFVLSRRLLLISLSGGDVLSFFKLFFGSGASACLLQPCYFIISRLQLRIKIGNLLRKRNNERSVTVAWFHHRLGVGVAVESKATMEWYREMQKMDIGEPRVVCVCVWGGVLVSGTFRQRPTDRPKRERTVLCRGRTHRCVFSRSHSSVFAANCSLSSPSMSSASARCLAMLMRDWRTLLSRASRSSLDAALASARSAVRRCITTSCASTAWLVPPEGALHVAVFSRGREV